MTVKFDLPFPAEVQLHIDGYIRSDVVLTPGSVEFNAVDQGEKAEKAIDIEYAGRNDWRVVDVRTTNPHLEAELVETKRAGGQVGYRLLVRLQKDASPGYLNEQLTIVTNDAKLPTFPLEVTGKVTSAVTVSPSPLFLGTLKPGQKVIKRIVVRRQETVSNSGR